MSAGGAHGRGARVARRVAGSAAAPAAAIGPAAQTPGKVRAAGLSIVSNSTLIVLKVVAGVVTGSIALLTEAVHSAIDLLASVVAFYSIRKADQPADADHPYGHAKVENLASAIEGMLILVGAGIIVFESVRRLVEGALLDSLGFGIAVVGFSGAWNLIVSGYLHRQARIADSPALEADAAHLRTDAMTSFGVLVGLVLVEVTGVEQLDPAVALLVAGAILAAGARIVTRSSRVLVDEALPEHELAAVREAVAGYGAAEVAGFHKLRARRAGAHRHVDLHVQFRRGTSLERAHAVAHELTAAIRARLRGAEVLVHIEPEEAVDPRAPGGADLRDRPAAGEAEERAERP